MGPVVEGVRDLRRTRYDTALDLQGLLKSAVLARLSGASRVVGFPSELLRERAARHVLYGDGRRGRASRHRQEYVDVEGRRHPWTRPRVSPRRSQPRRCCRRTRAARCAGGEALRAHQSRSRVAQQAVAPCLLCRGRARAGGTARSAIAGVVGAGRRTACPRHRRGLRRHRCCVGANNGGRSRLACRRPLR